jgi:hypothetical protein
VFLKGTTVRLFILPIVLIVALVLGVVPAVLADPITIFVSVRRTHLPSQAAWLDTR